MKKFFRNLSLFIIPILILFILKKVFYETSGDLGRLSKTFVDQNYRLKFEEDFNASQKFKLLTAIEKHKSVNKTRVLVLGDSFSSGQDTFGYVNQLAEFEDLEVVLYQDLLRKEIESNPILALKGLISSGYIEEYEFDYVVLQNIERDFSIRCSIALGDFFIDKDILEKAVNRPRQKVSKTFQEKLNYELNDFMLFYQFNCLYQLDKKAYNSKVCKFSLSSNPFSYGNQLLIYGEDLRESIISPSREDLIESINLLTQINKKLIKIDTKFISMIVPDKYDMYYSFIENKEDFPAPNFYQVYNSISKNYTDLNCFKILEEAIKTDRKDIYFYDDSHWSPIGHDLISKSLYSIIKNLQ
jgi:hypothetical protein